MILVNGREQDHLPAADRGLHFGDGVFETMAVEQGRPLCLERHLQRLADGCRRLAIPMPALDVLAGECARAGEGTERAVLKLTVTRGVGGRGYAPPEDAQATRMVASHPWPQYAAGARREGVRVRTCDTRLGRNPRLAGLKHLNRLEQVLARMEASSEQCDEGLMLDDRNRVVEGIMSNLFLYRQGRLHTPELSECGVAGIVRALVLEAAREVTGVEAEVAALGPADLAGADECFLTNSLIGLWPIKSIDGRPLPVGPVAFALQELLIERGAITRD